MCGGAGQSHQFWGMTGGKSLGAIVMLWEEDKLPIFPTLNPTVQKAMSKNIPFQFHVLTAYNDIYLTKKAIETAGGTTDVGKIINAFETVDIERVFGPFAYWGLKKEPWFHSGVITNPDDV